MIALMPYASASTLTIQPQAPKVNVPPGRQPRNRATNAASTII